MFFFKFLVAAITSVGGRLCVYLDVPIKVLQPFVGFITPARKALM